MPRDYLKKATLTAKSDASDVHATVKSILDDIEAHNYNVFSRRAHISNRGKAIRIPGIWWRAMGANY